jgi:autoinducer 2-binding protein LuxP
MIDDDANRALTRRLDELGIAQERTQCANRQIEHTLQSTDANQVAQDAGLHGIAP